MSVLYQQGYDDWRTETQRMRPSERGYKEWRRGWDDAERLWKERHKTGDSLNALIAVFPGIVFILLFVAVIVYSFASK